VVAAVAVFGRTPFGQHLSLLGQDALQAVAAPAVDLSGTILVDVDESSVTDLLPALGPWPYDRSVFARLNDFLAGRGARTVLYDVVFADPRPGDERMRESLARTRFAWLAAIVHDRPSALQLRALPRFDSLARAGALDLPRWPGLVLPTETLGTEARVGVVSVTPDADGQVRRVPVLFDTPAGVLPGIWLSALVAQGDPVGVERAAGQAWLQGGGRRVALADDGSITLLVPRQLRRVPVLSFAAVYAAMDDGRVQLPDFSGKTVIVGSTAAVLGDETFLPGGQAVSGLKVLALAWNSLANGQAVSAPRGGWHLWLCAACLLALWLAASARRRPLAWMSVAAVAGAAVLVLAAVLGLRLVLQQAPMYLPLLALAGAYAALAGMHLAREGRRDATTGFHGLPYLRARIESAIAGAHGSVPPALVYLRFDSLALVRESAGEQAADDLLRQLGAALKLNMPDGVPIARVAKNAFAAQLQDLLAATDVAGQLSEDLRAFRFMWLGRMYHVNVFVSVVGLDREFASADAALEAAEAECHTPVRTGSAINVYRRASRKLLRSEVDGLSLVSEALEGGTLELLFQPIVALQAGAPHPPHCEVLLAPISAGDTALGPAEFVPIAERHGLMPEVDRWVVRTALAAIASARASQPDLEPVVFAINLSGKSVVDRALVDFICDQAAAYAVPAQRLCFELTETAAVADIDAALDLTRRLHAAGCRLALDDFGVGFTSFDYLARLPISFLKIDGVFIRDLDRKAEFASMVRAMNEVGHALGLHTVAEHVESPLVRTRLAEIGVDYGQGYLFARPRPLAQIDSAAFAAVRVTKA